MSKRLAPRPSRAERTAQLREALATYLEASPDYRGMRAVVGIRWEQVVVTAKVRDLVTDAAWQAAAAEQHFEEWVLCFLSRAAQRQAEDAVTLYNDALDRAQLQREAIVDDLFPPLHQ